MNVKTALTTSARRSLITHLINSGGVESQAHLVKLLAKEGVKVTQATASRDLEELRAVRVKNVEGVMQYRLPENSTVLGNSPRNLILGVQASGNIAVVKTPAGGAQLLASAIDRNQLDGAIKNVIGTIAGDDTVLIISKSSTGGSQLSKEITAYSRKGR
jgi:transcriptional regulator of arginine metabolism